MITGNRNTSWMDLRITRITEQRTFFMCSPGCRYIRTFCVSGKEKYVSISACTQQYGMATVGFYLTGNEVTGNNAARLSIHQYHVQHFSTVVHLYLAVCNLPVQGRV